MTGIDALLRPDEGWPRPRPGAAEVRADALVAAGVFAGAVLSLNLNLIAGVFGDGASFAMSILWALAVSAPLALRRRAPATAAFLVAAAFIAGQMATIPEFVFSNISLFLALYSVGAWSDNRLRSHVVRTTIVVGMFCWLVVSIAIQSTDPAGFPGFERAGAFSPLLAYLVTQFITNLIYFGGAYLFGEHAYRSAVAEHELRRRSAELARERATHEAQAVTLERLRIARELHDVVAHHVSVMGVQAGAARVLLDADPRQAAAALAAVEGEARTAISELHGLLGTLRDADRSGGGADPASSTLGAADIPDLVAASRELGLAARYETVGEPAEVPALIGLTLYRVAQEALTNARKYAGPSAVADVRVRHLDDAVEIEVANSGRVPARRRSGGLGIVGMRERVGAVGGDVEIGPRPRGGYLVRARIPLPAPARTDPR